MLDMALVLYDGKAIAFGPSREIFARVGAAKPPAKTAAGTTARRPALAESVNP